MDLYQQYIHKSRYSRYLDDLKRRENWEETVNRYFDFFDDHLSKTFQYKMDRVRLQNAVTFLDVMPSMRSVMSAGKALYRDNTAGYNCSALPVDDPKSFDEAMYILLCGTGVGFSVERKYVSKMPEVPDMLFESATTIVVADSKEGWAKALRQLIALLYSGEIPKLDVSRVREAGARLKTFGGRASGPGPLVDLFHFVITVFKKAAGRRLNSIECHDIMCKVGDVVVVGGVRRSAMISLTDLDDDYMRTAKSGNWFPLFPYRQLANNSAVYDVKPEIGQFMREWLSLYDSKSGERGIFSRDACKRQVEKIGRRDPEHVWLTNPCAEIILRPYQFCNLTEVIVRDIDTKETLLDKVEVATILGTYQSTLTKFPYLRKIWQKNTEEERLLGVSLTGILDNKILSSVTEDTATLLRELKQRAIDVNKKISEELNIAQSTAITCVKPSGTVSQLTNTSSGIHARHSQYYIRTVRNDKRDPLTEFLANSGVPNEPCVSKPDSTVVFSFPQKAPNTSVMREDISAIDHLRLWLMYQRNYCEHKPSITVYVQEHEWMDVGAWVYRHIDELSGVSFLPYDGGSYAQAPYTECSKEFYEKFLEKMPQSIDWGLLIENTDNVEGAQTLACSSGVCEI